MAQGPGGDRPPWPGACLAALPAVHACRRSSRRCTCSAPRHPAIPVAAGGVCRPRRRKCLRRRFGHDDDRTRRSPRAGSRYRSGREPAQPSAVSASEHQQVAAADKFGKLRGGPSADHLLPGRHVVGHPPNGLVDGGPDQCMTVCHLVGERIPGRPGGVLVDVGHGHGRWTNDGDQKQPHPAPTGLPDRPRQRPPARSGAADAHDQARDLAGPVIHGASPPASHHAAS